MKEKFRSLKFNLLFDLSLLTLCALILSEGIIILWLRQAMPHELADIGKSYLKTNHLNFVQSDSFKEKVSPSSPTRKNEADLTFKEFLKQQPAKEGWAFIDLQVFEPSDFPDVSSLGDLSISTRQSLFFIPTVYEYELLEKGPQGLLYQYKWSIEPFHNFLSAFKYKVFILIIFIQALVVILGYFLLFRRSVLRPVANLSAVSKAFLAGNWSARCSIERRDELGKVAEALNEMAINIQEKEKKLMLTIDSLKKVNEELAIKQNEHLQIEKLASIGRLAAGVAHEVGNPLGAISGYVDILKRSMEKLPGANKEDIDLCVRIDDETARISRIIRALLQQARPAKERIQAVKLKPLIERSVDLAQTPDSIKITYEFENDDAAVFAEQDQLIQIFLNLLVNARHAIEGKDANGEIKIQCALRKLPVYNPHPGSDSESVYDTSVVQALEPKEYWVTTVVDNGIGIDDEDRMKLFEPFFSTKAPGKGTGLGLYVSKSVVESFGGAIIVRSALGYGSSFSVFLPQAEL
jgi:signal transduction histidine kinase